MNSRRPIAAAYGALIVVATVGLALNVWLLLGTAGSRLAGCGGGGCDEVWASRWGQVFGIPVPVLAAGVYAVILILLLTGQRRWGVTVMMLLPAAAALWFGAVLVFGLRTFCPWCVAVHAVGVVLAVLSLLVGMPRSGLAAGAALGMTGVLALAQAFGPAPTGNRLDEIGMAAESGRFQARGEGRVVSFGEGSLTFNVAGLPRLGSMDAEQVMVEYFDYRCEACRTMHGFLQTLLARHPEKLALIVLPVPLEGSCNRAMGAGDVEHPGGCGVARVALAAWRAKPEVFAEVHGLFFLRNPANAEEALKLVSPRIERKMIEEALADPWIDELIAADVDDWVTLSRGTKVMPKLLITGKRVSHGLPSGQEDFIRVIEGELDL